MSRDSDDTAAWADRIFDVMVDAVRRHPRMAGLSAFDAEVAFGDLRKTLRCELAAFVAEVIEEHESRNDDEDEVAVQVPAP